MQLWCFYFVDLSCIIIFSSVLWLINIEFVSLISYFGSYTPVSKVSSVVLGYRVQLKLCIPEEVMPLRLLSGIIMFSWMEGP